MQTGRARSQHDSRRYDGIVFDVGGTLIGFPNQAPFQSFLAQAGLPAADRDARAFHRRFLTVVGAERDKAQGLGAEEADLNAWWHTVFDRTWPDRPDLAEEMYRWLRADRFDRLFDDVVPTLEALGEIEMPMGVLSNFGSNLEDLLQRLGLGDCFAFVIVSSLVGLAKPDPRIFDLAAAKMGRPPPPAALCGRPHGRRHRRGAKRWPRRGIDRPFRPAASGSVPPYQQPAGAGGLCPAAHQPGPGHHL